MPKNLIVIRHAKAQEKQEEQTDFERDLSKEGEMEAKKMGEVLYELGLKPQKIIASAAQRTKRTAEIFAKILNYEIESILFEKKIYQATLETLLKQIKEFDNQTETIFLIGHNPTFTYLVEYLIGLGIRDMPTCSAVHVQFEEDDWSKIDKQTGNLIWFKHPHNI